MTEPLIPFRDLPPARQAELRAAHARAESTAAGTCSMEIKIARFAAFLAPHGVSFTEADLPGRRTRPDRIG
ncbi:hypothetical protein [Phaeovulum vinaykumarii]|uniref:Uncharacterized protein n=1 Tax=Phaeovulum vinaykumarii TaxID=407234 RepID=A0A1N7LTR3_9RHOB|nr:hypothetical protein [Phaeovulum vinaykumarii]SIS77245.1 hypothetical protein SAMN05421795_104107 [Phaeovulum vinaykumarii]SOC07518.1 hypothetical protein SAMN05878426_104147 [Phaeovulum vinaykumarii]